MNFLSAKLAHRADDLRVWVACRMRHLDITLEEIARETGLDDSYWQRVLGSEKYHPALFMPLLLHDRPGKFRQLGRDIAEYLLSHYAIVPFDGLNGSINDGLQEMIVMIGKTIETERTDSCQRQVVIENYLGNIIDLARRAYAETRKGAR